MVIMSIEDNNVEKSVASSPVEVKTGWYEATVGKITNTLKPYLHQKTQDFVDKSVEANAKDNPKLARMIEFEVKRRGDGAGLTQDVAEPVLWVGVKTALALAIAVLTESLKDGKLKMVGRITVLGTVLNNAVELFRTVPRYVAGLQGSLEMAKDRWHSIEETGVDPFDHGGRVIHKAKDDLFAKQEAQLETAIENGKKWAEANPKRDILAVDNSVNGRI